MINSGGLSERTSSGLVPLTRTILKLTSPGTSQSFPSSAASLSLILTTTGGRQLAIAQRTATTISTINWKIRETKRQAQTYTRLQKNKREILLFPPVRIIKISQHLRYVHAYKMGSNLAACSCLSQLCDVSCHDRAEKQPALDNGAGCISATRPSRKL